MKIARFMWLLGRSKREAFFEFDAAQAWVLFAFGEVLDAFFCEVNVATCRHCMTRYPTHYRQARVFMQDPSTFCSNGKFQVYLAHILPFSANGHFHE